MHIKKYKRERKILLLRRQIRFNVLLNFNFKSLVAEPCILFSSGNMWEKTRKFAEISGRSDIDVAAYKGKPIEKIKDLHFVSVSNVIHSFVFG